MTEGTAATAMRSIVRPNAMNGIDTFVVKGRLGRPRKVDGVFYTIVVKKARDEYSNPSHLEIKSKAPLGDTGEEADVPCYVDGYTYEFKTKDGQKATRCVMTLVAVD